MTSTGAPVRLLRGYLAARGVSMLGDRLYEVAVPLAMLAAGLSAAAVGSVLAISQLPAVLLAPTAGELADRNPSRQILVACDLVRSALVVLVIAAFSMGKPSPALLGAAALAVGIADVFFRVVNRTVLPAVVPKTDLVRVNAHLEAIDASVSLVGPVAAGVLVGLVGVGPTLALDSASFLLSALLLQRLLPPLRRAPGAAAITNGERLPRLRGFTLLWRDRQQRSLELVHITLAVESGAGLLLLLVVLQREFDAKPGLVGALLSITAVGGLIAALILPKVVGELPWKRVCLVLLAVAAGATAGIAAAPSVAVVAVFAFLLEAAVASAYISSGSARQALAPDGQLGVMSGASFVLTSLATAGAAAVAGFLSTSFGPRPTLLGFGVLIATVALATAAITNSPTQAYRLRYDARRR